MLCRQIGLISIIPRVRIRIYIYLYTDTIESQLS